jgi:hypothetical protein
VAAPLLHKPIRSEYASDSDFLDACVIESARYTRDMIKSIDRTPRVTVDAHTRDAYDEYRKYGKARTIHDYLAENLDLCARYKREGVKTLFDI